MTEKVMEKRSSWPPKHHSSRNAATLEAIEKVEDGFASSEIRSIKLVLSNFGITENRFAGLELVETSLDCLNPRIFFTSRENGDYLDGDSDLPPRFLVSAEKGVEISFPEVGKLSHVIRLRHSLGRMSSAKGNTFEADPGYQAELMIIKDPFSNEALSVAIGVKIRPHFFTHAWVVVGKNSGYPENCVISDRVLADAAQAQIPENVTPVLLDDSVSQAPDWIYRLNYLRRVSERRVNLPYTKIDLNKTVSRFLSRDGLKTVRTESGLDVVNPVIVTKPY